MKEKTNRELIAECCRLLGSLRYTESGTPVLLESICARIEDVAAENERLRLDLSASSRREAIYLARLDSLRAKVREMREAQKGLKHFETSPARFCVSCESTEHLFLVQKLEAEVDEMIK